MIVVGIGNFVVMVKVVLGLKVVGEMVLAAAVAVAMAVGCGGSGYFGGCDGGGGVAGD